LEKETITGKEVYAIVYGKSFGQKSDYFPETKGGDFSDHTKKKAVAIKASSEKNKKKPAIGKLGIQSA
jgi:hypothetical protein